MDFWTRKLISLLIWLLPHESLHNKWQKCMTIALYFLRTLTALTVLFFLTSGRYPFLFGCQQESGMLVGFMTARCLLAVAYILFPNRPLALYFLSQLLQLVSLWLFRRQRLIPVLLTQFLASIVYVVCKAQRKGNFDSRILYKNFFIVVTLVQLQAILLNSVDEIEVNNLQGLLFLFLLANIGSLAAAYHDPIYNAKTKHLLYWAQVLTASLTAYFFALQICFGSTFTPQITDYQFSFILAACIFAFKYKYFQPNIDITLLTQDPEQLSSSHNKQYVLEAIKLLESSDIPRNQILELLESHKKFCRFIPCSLCRQESGQIERSFSEFLLRKLTKKFRKDRLFLDFIVYYFANSKRRRFMKYLGDGFFDQRELKAFESSLQANDFQQSIKLIQHCNQRVLKSSLNYLKNMRFMLNQILNNSININYCHQVGLNLLQDYETLYSVESKVMQQSQSDSKSTKNTKVGLENHVSLYALEIINLMREVVFSDQILLPRTLVNPDSILFDQQEGLFCISAEEDSIGTVVAVNRSALSLTSYQESELVGKNIEILLHPSMAAKHRKILQNRIIQREADTSNQLRANIFIISKKGDLIVCQIISRFVNGFTGKKWIVQLKDITGEKALLASKESGEIIATSYKVKQLFLDGSLVGQTIPLSFLSLLGNLSICSKSAISGIPTITMGFSAPDTLQVLHQSSLTPPFKIIRIQPKGEYSTVLASSSLMNSSEGQLPSLASFQPKFQFNYTISLSDQANSQQLEDESEKDHTFQRWKLQEEICELMYIDEELEPRENKILEEQSECEVHPFAKKYEQLAEQKYEFSAKDDFVKKVSKKLKKQNCFQMVAWGSLFFIYFVNLVFTVYSGILSIESGQILETKFQMQGLLRMRTVKFLELAAMISSPVWESLNIEELQQLLQIDTYQTVNRICGEIDELTKKINQKQDLDEKWKLATFTDKIPNIQSNYSHDKIMNQLRLSLQKLEEQPQEELNTFCFQQLLKIVRIVTPINLYIAQEYFKEIDERVVAQKDLAEMLVAFWGGLCCVLGFVLVRQVKMQRENIQKYVGLLSYFPEGLLETYSKSVKNVEQKILLADHLKCSEMLNAKEQEALEQQLLKKKRQIYTTKFKHLRNLFFITLLGLIFFTFIFFTDECFVYVARIKKTEPFSHFYGDTLAYLNIEWLNSVIDLSGHNFYGSTDQEPTLLHEYWQISSKQFQKDFKELMYENEKGLKANLYSEQFVREYQRTFSAPLCSTLQLGQDCAPKLYKVSNFDELIQASIVLEEKSELLLNNSSLRSTKEQIQFELFSIFTVHQPKINKLLTEVVSKEIREIEKQLKFYIGRQNVTVFFASTLVLLIFIKVNLLIKRNARNSLKIVYKLFPVWLLKTNVYFCHEIKKICQQEESCS